MMKLGAFILCGLHLVLAANPVVYKSAHYDVTDKKGVVYGQGQSCADKARTPSGCKPMDQLLDVYLPNDGQKALRPAIIYVHGGGWEGKGPRAVLPMTQSAGFHAARGFVTFVINYRIGGDNGTFPAGWPVDPRVTADQSEAVYPATRDIKASVRFVRAQAAKYNVDPERIAIYGGSAGAISSIAVGAVFDDDYKSELAATDPTLPSTYLNASSKVRCVVSHWGAGYAIDAVTELDPKHASRYVSPPPLIEFHGDKDPIVPFKDAQAVQAAYQKVGAVYEMHVMEGKGHSAWCDGCPENAKKSGACIDDTKYCDANDVITLPFLATHMDLTLE